MCMETATGAAVCLIQAHSLHETGQFHAGNFSVQETVPDRCLPCMHDVQAHFYEAGLNVACSFRIGEFWYNEGRCEEGLYDLGARPDLNRYRKKENAE